MISQKQSNGNVSWDVYIQPSLDICLFGDSPLGVFYILIGVGLSALLVSTNWAMREPYYVERASGLAPRFFCIHVRTQLSL